jgi:dTDP-glucose 4,6-dehydratase
VRTIGSAILRSLGKPAELLQSVEDRPGHVVRHAVDWSKIRTRLGWKPEHPFEQGLRDTIAWYRENTWWWEPVKSGEFRDYYRVQYRGLA